MKQIIKAIKKCKNVAIFVHVSPDGDCLGSASAFLLALKALGKNATIYSSDVIGMPFAKTNYFNHVNVCGDATTKEFDLYASVDVSSSKQLGIYEDAFIQTSKNTICIDHHASNTRYAKQNYIRPDAAAAGEIVFDVINALKVKITPQIADLLYIAIMSDTACLLNGNATPKTLEILSKLQKYGANHKAIIDMMFKNKSKNQVEIENVIQSKTKFCKNCAICSLTLRDVEKYNMANFDLGSMVHLLSEIEGVKLAAIVREIKKGVTKGSIRSNGEIDCISIAQEFGGGGHVSAAGFRTTDKTLYDVTRKLTKIMQEKANA